MKHVIDMMCIVLYTTVVYCSTLAYYTMVYIVTLSMTMMLYKIS